MSAPVKVKDLVNRFQDQLEAYKSGKYNETQVRREFIDPFFKALGWDVANEQGAAEAYKDVIHEATVKVGGATKAPDYCFRIGGNRKFFLEAKKPSINIKDDPHPAFQLRRYAWSAKLQLSIVTDFEEFAVYDCRTRPVKSDKSSKERVMYFTFDQYLDQWDEIAGIFSFDAIRNGSFDKYVESNKKKRGTAEVDTAFLEEIEAWREALAKNLALRNPELSQRELNYVVQATIDRIIFLRICEDRGIEDDNRLMALQNGNNVYQRLCELFRQADDRYNSGLFHFQEEKDRPGTPDGLTFVLNIDDKVLKGIFKHLYYPDSPYEFSVLPADILGQVYEQFLGKVIRLTGKHRAVVEEKPEVKKAGGVYYTPTYIVDYIVKHTVGKLLEGKTARQAANLKVLDPACGSGSFLIGAYQYLLDWYRDWYVNDGPEKHKKLLYQGHGGEWRLGTDERKRILLKNIYGVDIDSQAVEVTKLSLLLKVLEGETSDTLNKQMALFHARALPDLRDNIKCGNSLISPKIYQQQQIGLLDNGEHHRINVFDWQDEFPEIFKGKNGGFDAVIGNPPYIRIQILKEWAPLEVEHYKERYSAASKGNYDIYVVFVERGLGLLNKKGQLGFILPHKFFNAKYGEPLRKLISEGKHLGEVVHFGDQQVFSGATTYTCLMFLDKTGAEQCLIAKVSDIERWRNAGEMAIGQIGATSIAAAEWNFVVGKHAALFEKLSTMPIKLGDIADRIFQGLITGADKVFILKNDAKGRYFSEETKQSHEIEREIMHPLCKGSINIRRYHITDLTKSILFPYKNIGGRAQLLLLNEMQNKYPLAWVYLEATRSILEARERGKWKHDKWYAFGRSQNLSEMEQKKLMVPSIAKSASYTLDSKDYYYFVGSGGGGGGGYGITLKSDNQMAYEYVLGLLNSKLLDTFLKSFSSPFSGGYFAYNRQYIEQLPIRCIDSNSVQDRTRHDRMVSFVEQMLALHKQLLTVKTDHDKNIIQRQIDNTNQKIDQLVYELYGLTDEEIKIVEESVA
ncbi:MAG TPA: restriction endonuclease subunit M [Gammaproteobacteria bacterium]|nr:restriction endonuclease subunit M [Gammaproteobacteria bacterium]